MSASRRSPHPHSSPLHASFGRRYQGIERHVRDFGCCIYFSSSSSVEPWRGVCAIFRCCIHFSFDSIRREACVRLEWLPHILLFFFLCRAIEGHVRDLWLLHTLLFSSDSVQPSDSHVRDLSGCCTYPTISLLLHSTLLRTIRQSFISGNILL